jgi:hypothetical protein
MCIREPGDRDLRVSDVLWPAEQPAGGQSPARVQKSYEFGPRPISFCISYSCQNQSQRCAVDRSASAPSMNFQSVAVNDAGLPAEIIRKRWHGVKTYHREEQSRERESSERHVERPITVRNKPATKLTYEQSASVASAPILLATWASETPRPNDNLDPTARAALSIRNRPILPKEECLSRPRQPGHDWHNRTQYRIPEFPSR